MFKSDMSITFTVIFSCLILMYFKLITETFAIFVILAWISLILVHFKDWLASMSKLR